MILQYTASLWLMSSGCRNAGAELWDFEGVTVLGARFFILASDGSYTRTGTRSPGTALTEPLFTFEPHLARRRDFGPSAFFCTPTFFFIRHLLVRSAFL